MRNEDFQVFLAGMKRHRERLFEEGESASELKSVFEKIGMRKMLKILMSEEGINQMFGR